MKTLPTNTYQDAIAVLEAAIVRFQAIEQALTKGSDLRAATALRIEYYRDAITYLRTAAQDGGVLPPTLP